jgi:hypothetical protein
MTPQLQAAITAIEPLSSMERQQLLQLLTQDDAVDAVARADLQTLSTQFWQGTSLQQLLVTQTPQAFDTLEAPDFWPEEDSIEDFLIFLQQQRQTAS